VGSHTRWYSLAIGALLVVVWFAFFRPAFLGGPASYVLVSGTSMEPTLSTGDLAYVRRASSYEVGDIVAFRVPEGGLVIHRIVGGNGQDGYVPQGDNKPAADEWRPTDDDVVGREAFVVPGVGDLLRRLSDPVRFGVLTVSLFTIAGLGERSIRQGTRKGRTMGLGRWRMGSSGRASALAGSWWPGSTRLLAIVAAAALLVLVSGIYAWRAFREPLVRTQYVEHATYDQNGSFDYTAVMTPSTLYPDGVMRPEVGANGEASTRQPLYTRVTREMLVSFEYELATSESLELAGEISADLVIRAGDGWTSTQELQPVASFDGPSASGQFRIDFDEIEALVRRVESETGFAPGVYTLSVEPVVNVNGTIAQESRATSFSPTFEIAYGETVISPQRQVVERSATTLGDYEVARNEIGAFGLSIPVEAARWLSGIAGTAALASILAVLASLYLGLGRSETGRIQARYRSMLVPVESAGRDHATAATHVGSIRHLARLAGRGDGIIFHEELPGMHRYFVRAGDDTYEYGVRPARIDEIAKTGRPSPIPGPGGS
jgi:signal peptidase I